MYQYLLHDRACQLVKSVPASSNQLCRGVLIRSSHLSSHVINSGNSLFSNINTVFNHSVRVATDVQGLFSLLNVFKNNDFLGHFFLSGKNAVFHNFLCFPFCMSFPWFFCVFCILGNLPLYPMPWNSKSDSCSTMKQCSLDFSQPLNCILKIKFTCLILQYGDYNKPIPAQYHEDFNHYSSIGKRQEDRTAPSPSQSEGVLCEQCNINQTLKVQQLSAFVPYNEVGFAWNLLQVGIFQLIF